MILLSKQSMREYHLIALTLIVCIFHITHMFGVIGPIYPTECARLCMVCPFHASASLGPHFQMFLFCLQNAEL